MGPLDHVAKHVVQAKRIGLFLAHGMCRKIAVAPIPRDVTQVSVTACGGACPSGVFPFRLGRQPSSYGAAILVRVVPGDHFHGKVASFKHAGIEFHDLLERGLRNLRLS